MSGGGKLARRAGWGLGDQAFSSATNFVLNILIARSLGAATFGAFTLAFGVYVIWQNLSRALTSEPLLIRYTGVSRERWREGAGEATGVAVLFGILGTLVSLGAAWFVDGDLRIALMAVGICLPGVLLQDLWRSIFFAAGQGGRAMLSDVLWAVFMFPPLLVLLADPDPSLFMIIIAWGGAAALAGLVAAAIGRTRPRFFRAKIWLKHHRDLTPHFMGELGTGSIFAQLGFFGIGAVAGLTAVGAYRAAHVLFGPIRVVFQGLGQFGVPEAVRFLGESPRKLRVAARRTAVVLALLSVVAGVLLMLIPETWGTVLLGDTWLVAEPLLLPFTLGMVGLALMMPTVLGLRALEAAKESFRTKLAVSTADLLATVGGAFVGGAVGAAWAGRVVSLLGSGMWWSVFGKQLHKRRGRSPLEGTLAE